MKPGISIFFLFLLTSAFLPIQKKTEEVISENRGYLLKKFVVHQSTINTTIYATIIDPRTVRVKIEGLTQKYSNGRSAIEVGRKGAKVVLGGGFMSSFYPIIPLGFLKIDGAVITALKTKGYNGVAGVKNGVLSLLSSSSQSATNLDEGFQTGPFLIREGKIVFKPTTDASRNAYNRAFVGFNVNGKILVAVTTEPVTLQQLAQYLLNSAYADLKCQSVLNLSGGGSETLVVRGMNKQLFTYGSFNDNQSALIAFY